MRKSHQKGNGQKIVVGLSGGIDSSMALVFLKKAGWQPVGVSLKFSTWSNKKNSLAKDICQKLDIPYHVFNVEKEFQEKVIHYFIEELKKNRTPNPCVICNRYLKFKQLFEWANQHGIQYVATGHYARTRKNSKTKKYELLKAKDEQKNQTYVLSLLPQGWLECIIFPLGDYTKKEIYRLADKEGFASLVAQKQSQDFCFVANKSLDFFLEKEIGARSGPIKDSQGHVLGKHRGLHFYTIGQRKRINLPGGPYFVKELDIKKNVLLVTKNEKEIFSKTVFLSSLHFISGKHPQKEIKVTAKIRYSQPSAKAALFPLKGDKVKLVFQQPQRAITPGQFAVFYKKDICLGSASINKYE